MSREPTSRLQQQLNSIERLMKAAESTQRELQQRRDALVLACDVAPPNDPVHPRLIRVTAQLACTQAEITRLRRVQKMTQARQVAHLHNILRDSDLGAAASSVASAAREDE
jgi:conjugal transfer/entry exclusion protein